MRATWPDLESWCRLKHLTLSIYEVDVLLELDSLKPADREEPND